jgi:hypothetical protein
VSKLAIFVEGLTEQLFAERLVRYIAGVRGVRVELRRTTGEVSERRRFRLLSVDPDVGQPHYVLIVDCSNDDLVNSRIREEYESLVRAGYSLIIGIRDVYPQPRADVPRIRRRITYGIRQIPIPVVGILGVMEVEAWFLAEHSQFGRLNPVAGVDCAMIHSWFRFDPSTDDMSDRPHPALDMSKVYFLAGVEYRKERAYLERAVNALDMDAICFTVPEKFPDLKLLVSSIDEFLFPAAPANGS